jgi:hypothetical protein
VLERCSLPEVGCNSENARPASSHSHRMLKHPMHEKHLLYLGLGCKQRNANTKLPKRPALVLERCSLPEVAAALKMVAQYLTTPCKHNHTLTPSFLKVCEP